MSVFMNFSYVKFTSGLTICPGLCSNLFSNILVLLKIFTFDIMILNITMKFVSTFCFIFRRFQVQILAHRMTFLVKVFAVFLSSCKQVPGHTL
jgi:hypothetical protein